MPCQCGTTAVAGGDAAGVQNGCECSTGADVECACGTGGGVDAGIDQRGLERVVMELDMRVRKLEAGRSR